MAPTASSRNDAVPGCLLVRRVKTSTGPLLGSSVNAKRLGSAISPGQDEFNFRRSNLVRAGHELRRSAKKPGGYGTPEWSVRQEDGSSRTARVKTRLGSKIGYEDHDAFHP